MLTQTIFLVHSYYLNGPKERRLCISEGLGTVSSNVAWGGRGLAKVLLKNFLKIFRLIFEGKVLISEQI
jgi:hypothetical protein